VDSPNRIQSVSIRRTNWSVLCVEMIGVLLSTKTHSVGKLQTILSLRQVVNFFTVELQKYNFPTIRRCIVRVARIFGK
jgi:hypothetical protein